MADTDPTTNATSQPLNSTNPDPMDQELDTEIDMSVDPAAPDPSNPSLDGPLPESREPTKKDISLRDFLTKMDDYAPIIPDAVTQHHLLLAGLSPQTTPLPLARLLALATQKFIADIAADAYQYSRMRTSATGAGQSAATNALAAASGGQPAEQGQGKGGKDDKGKAGAHVLGVQRAGYGGGGGGGGQAGRAVLTMEDLGCAVGEYGVNVKRGEFYR